MTSLSALVATTLKVELPTGVGLHQAAVGTTSSLEISDRSKVVALPSGFATVTNVGGTSVSWALDTNLPPTNKLDNGAYNLQAYATDAAARAAADQTMAKGFDALVPPVWRKFFYMPLHHSENADDQCRSIELLQAVPNDPARTDNIRYTGRYLYIIERFGRFPHRNAVLGRTSTLEELAFLAEPESQLDLLKVRRPEGEPPCR